MSDSSAIVRALILYGIVLPLAILLGYMLVKLPEWDNTSIVVIGIVLGILCLPLLLRWHHPLLFLSWNMPAVVFFLPGRPELWIFMAVASFLIVLIQKAINLEVQLNPAPFVLWALIFILVVVVGTAYMTGGIHLNSLGGDSLGGRKYIYMIAAVLGFIAMTSLRIPENKVRFYVGAFFLGALPNVFGDLIHFAGSWLEFILYLFPSQIGSWYSDTDTVSIQNTGMFRDYGLTVASAGVLFNILARYGIRNLLQGGIVKVLFTMIIAVSCLLGGFRGMLVLILLLCFIMFWLEGLFRSKYVLMPVVVLLICLPLAPFADRLPLSIQLTLSVVPIIKVSSEARLSAEASSEWRIKMWQILLPEVPHYFWLGKGFQANTSEFVSTIITQRQGIGGDSEAQMMAGDFHIGPLSVIIPFGIWGAIGWFWFFAAGLRGLAFNY